ncbi:hypothetical protein G6F68_018581 [Rhizopus microsporus]|nr:hypothetical protein G6F68_018581 [Rhizopus microsporus]
MTMRDRVLPRRASSGSGHRARSGPPARVRPGAGPGGAAAVAGCDRGDLPWRRQRRADRAAAGTRALPFPHRQAQLDRADVEHARGSHGGPGRCGRTPDDEDGAGAALMRPSLTSSRAPSARQ